MSMFQTQGLWGKETDEWMAYVYFAETMARQQGEAQEEEQAFQSETPPQHDRQATRGEESRPRMKASDAMYDRFFPREHPGKVLVSTGLFYKYVTPEEARKRRYRVIR
jgi:hypothetical protein